MNQDETATSSRNQQLNRNKNKKKDKFAIWSQTFSKKRDDVVMMSFGHQDRIKKIFNMVNDEERNKDSLKMLKDNLGGNRVENSKRNKSILPEKVHANIKETRRLNNELKKQVDDISRMNALYIIKHGNKYLDVKNENGNRDADLPKINEMKKVFEGEKKIRPKNFRYINDNYRTQLMRAFLNFNPSIHLNNLRNLLEKADPAIQQ